MRILLVEDDPALAGQIGEALGAAGYAVDRAGDGVEAAHLGANEPYDAVILDLGLPEIDGLSVLEGWRQAGRAMPVLILTARDRWRDKVQGIDAGADDYLAKPFHMEELLARLRALIRRAAGHAKAAIEIGSLAFDTRTGRLTRDGAAIRLTGHETRLLAYLMHHRGRLVSRSELTDHLYAQDFDRDSNTIEVLIARLRRKLGPGIIASQRGLGYGVGMAGDGDG